VSCEPYNFKGSLDDIPVTDHQWKPAKLIVIPARSAAVVLPE